MAWDYSYSNNIPQHALVMTESAISLLSQTPEISSECGFTKEPPLYLH